MPQALQDILEENSLLKDRDYYLSLNQGAWEAKGLKLYRCDLVNLLDSDSKLDYRCIKVDAEDPEDDQMDFLSVEIFFKKGKG